MKTEAVVAASWDDLVFENRNKEYGAYYVRKSYSSHVVYALGLGLLTVALIIGLPAIVSLLKGNEICTLPKVNDFTWTVTPETMVNVIPKIQPPSHPATIRRVHHDLIPVVTTAEVPTGIVTPADEMVEMVSEPGEVTSEGSSIGPLITPEEVPITKTLEPLNFAAEMPEYIGGYEAMIKFVQKKIIYPASARRTGVDGTVYIRFIVDTEGRITHPEVIRGISAECDAEALRIISMMPLWKAGRQNHIPVSAKMVLPIKFKIE